MMVEKEICRNHYILIFANQSFNFLKFKYFNVLKIMEKFFLEKLVFKLNTKNAPYREMDAQYNITNFFLLSFILVQYLS